MSAIAPPDNVQANRNNSIECRVWKRHSCLMLSRCQPVAARGGDELNWEGKIKDISEGGIGLVCVRRFEPGSGLALQVSPGDGAEVETLLARVVHVTKLDNGQWQMGCAFVSELSDDHVKSLLRQNPTNASANGSQSQNSSQVQSYEKSKDRSGAVIPKVWWQNEETGVRRCIPQLYLNVSWPLKPQKTIRLWLSPNKSASKPTRLTVNACTKEPDGWLVRFSFDGDTDPATRQWFE